MLGMQIYSQIRSLLPSVPEWPPEVAVPRSGAEESSRASHPCQVSSTLDTPSPSPPSRQLASAYNRKSVFFVEIICNGKFKRSRVDFNEIGRPIIQISAPQRRKRKFCNSKHLCKEKRLQSRDVAETTASLLRNSNVNFCRKIYRAQMREHRLRGTLYSYRLKR